MLNTRVGENYNANDVINSNDLRKRLLSIDSRFRTNLNDPSTNFQYRCEHTYKNIIRIKLSSIELPNMFYTFMASKGNTSFVVTTKDKDSNTRTLTVTIPDGNYTITELITQIQTQFNTGFRDPYGIFLQITYNSNNEKVTLQHNGLSAYPVTSSSTLPSIGAFPISFDFQPTLPDLPNSRDRNYNCGIGYHLGFHTKILNLNTPTSTTPFNTYTYTATCVVDVTNDTYCFLQVNDFHTVEHNTIEKYFQAFAKVIIRENKRAVIYDDGSNLLSNEIIFPSPIDLTTLHIRLIDPWGDVMSLCGVEFSFTLEITEVTNTKLYDFYRNYIWLGTIPSVPSNVRGAAVGLLHGRGP